MARMAAWAGVALGAVYLVFVGGGWFGIYLPTLRAASAVICLGVFAVWLVAARRNPIWRPGTRLVPAISLVVASLLLSAVASRHPRVSFEYVGYAVVLAALYLLLVRLLAQPFYRSRLVGLLSGLFVALSLAFIVRSLDHWITWWSALGRVTVPPLRPEFESLMFGNPSTVMTIVALLAVPALATLPVGRRSGKALVVGVVALVATVTVISGSRSGWLAIAVAIVLVVGAAAVHGATRHSIMARLREPARRRMLALGLPLLTVAAMAGVLVLGPALVQRATAGGESNRVQFVTVAFRQFAESPVVGAGPGSWVIERVALTQPGEPNEYIPHAHNLYAQTLAELGVMGAAAGIMLVGSLATLLHGAIIDPDARRRRWGWVTLLALFYFAAHQLLDFYPNMPAVLFAAAFPVAYLDATAPRPRRRLALPRAVRRASGAVLIGAALVAAAGLAWQEAPARSNELAVEKANDGRWDEGVAPAQNAAAADTDISPYQFTAGLMSARSGDHEAAARYFLRVAVNDDLPEAWLNLAQEQMHLGRPEQALESLRAALRLGRQQVAVAMAAGDLALRLGAENVAVDAFSAVLSSAPSIAADNWWTEEPSRASAFRQAVRIVREPPGPAAWEVSLMLGDAAAARDLASRTPDPIAAGDFTEAWLGDLAAHGRVLARCDANPFRLDALLACARIEGRLGRTGEADRWRYLANAQIGGTYAAGAELRVNRETPVGRSVEGGLAIFWGTYTYRRFTPWDLLLPDLVHLTLE